MAILITPTSLTVPFEQEPTTLQYVEALLKKTPVGAMDACEFLWYLHPEVYQESRLTAEYGPGSIQRYRGLLRSIDAQFCEFRALMAEMITWLDPYEAPYEILPLLAPIVGIDFNYDLPEEYARREIANAIFLWERKGTRDNFRDWIRFLTGLNVTLREFYKEVLRTNVWGQAYSEAPSTILNRGGDVYATLPHLDEHHATNTWAGNGYGDPPWIKMVRADTNYGTHGYSAAQDRKRLPGYLFRHHMGLYLDLPSELLDLTWYGSPFYAIFTQKIDRIIDLIVLYGVVVHLFWRLIDTDAYPTDRIPEDPADLVGETHCLYLDEPCTPRLANVILCTNVVTKVTNADGDSPQGGPWLTFTSRLRYWTMQQADTLETYDGSVLLTTDTLPVERTPFEQWVDPVIGATQTQGVEAACGVSSWVAAGIVEIVVHDEAWESAFSDLTIFEDNWNEPLPVLTLIYQETFPYQTVWTDQANYTQDWETASVWGGGSGSEPWVVDARSGGAGYGTPGTLDTTTPIQGSGSVRVRMPRTGTTADANYLVDILPRSYATVPPPYALSSARWRTLLRFEVPEFVAGATGVRPIVFLWNYYDQSLKGFILVFHYDIATGVVATWTYGRISGSRTVIPIQTGTFSPAINPGTTCAMEVEWYTDPRNAKSVSNVVKFGPGISFTTLPVLATQKGYYADDGLYDMVPYRGREHIQGYPTPDGVGIFTVDHTEILPRQDNSVETEYTLQWYRLWQYTNTTPHKLVHMLRENTPLVGTGSLRVRRDWYIPPGAATNRASYLGLDRFNNATVPGKANGKARLIVRADTVAGTLAHYVGLSALCSRAAHNDNLNRTYSLLYTLDPATQQWTTLSLVYFPSGWTPLPTFTTLATVERPRAIVDTLVTLQYEWYCNFTTNALLLIASVGSNPDYSDLTEVLRVELTLIQTLTQSFGEHPLVIFLLDNASTGQADLDVTIDNIELYG